NLLGIVFNPAGLQVDLAELLLSGSDDGARLIKENGARACGALVQGEDAFHGLLIRRPCLLVERIRDSAVSLIISAGGGFGQWGVHGVSQPIGFQFALPANRHCAYTTPRFTPLMNPILRCLVVFASVAASMASAIDTTNTRLVSDPVPGS